tara:strand:- start:710 stop:838 length:129 start_codon:yes stop_codon:yes gene_type:complete
MKFSRSFLRNCIRGIGVAMALNECMPSFAREVILVVEDGLID